MKLRSMILSAAMVATGLVLATEATAQQPDPAIRLTTASRTDVESMAVNATELEWWNVETMPGVQITYLLADRSRVNPYAYRMKFPTGYELTPHQHRERRFVTVLKGTYLVGFGPEAKRSETVEFGPGSFVVLPRNVEHFAWTRGETVIQVHGNGKFDRSWMVARK